MKEFMSMMTAFWPLTGSVDPSSAFDSSRE
jgi:hypothetical protein